MIVLAGGMQKAGTVWLYTLVNELFITGGGDDVNALRKNEQALDEIFLDPFATLQKMTGEKFDVLRSYHDAGYNFAVHSHLGLTKDIRQLMDDGACKVIYAFRDPRAVALSSFEFGTKLRARGKYRPFGWILNLEMGILYARKLIITWYTWQKIAEEKPHQVYLFKYERLLAEPVEVMTEICEFLSISLPLEKVVEIYKKYARDTLKDGDPKLREHLHLGVGEPNRYTQFTRWQKFFAKLVLGRHILKMGYPL